MISLFKKLFSKKLSKEEKEVWEELQKKHSNNPLDDPDCMIDYEYAIKLDHKERQQYLNDVWEARHRARYEQYVNEEKGSETKDN